MNGSYLLDTNIVIALFANDPAIRDYLKSSNLLFVPSIVIGELYFGARKSSRVQENLARVDDFASSNTILGCDIETARHYGALKDHLRKKGRPIPENDLWIAAITVQHDLTLITRDVHFGLIEGIRVSTW